MSKRFVFHATTRFHWKWTLVLLALVAAALTLPARADTVYTTIGTGICGGDPACIADHGINQNFDSVTGENSTIDPGFVEMIANAFTPASNDTLTDVQLVLQTGGLLSGTANVYLTANNAGVPGAVLESWLNVSGEAFALPQLNTITLTSALHPVLSSGTEYWLVVGPSANTTGIGWNDSWTVPANAVENVTPNLAGVPTLAGPWINDGVVLQSAFQIDGTPTGSNGGNVPEPGALGLLGTGLISLIMLSLRRAKSECLTA